eukprot:CAMPEP_0194782522 /NCGR_PEP_ID=MMETSP0323_2-20130528/78733_1 /TAXON_ID=2866 ORGANISM="Crypthecodinium cohnii, Strain Seligo" /NCGR_SAMPLE_ID=MMETSP0323_2 /ASSEMBLY_ACC=CAM_ASM_000346 /LENGTH=130 /DNA_ID=CAMNT_0039721339 /DNA_START=115 /DNA_END=507 /DNA_ORIENTATION=+
MRPDECSQADPEGAIGCEGRSAEGVASGKLPHARTKLRQATVEEAMGQDQVQQGLLADPSILEVQQDSGHSKAEEAQRSRVGDDTGHLSKKRGSVQGGGCSSSCFRTEGVASLELPHTSTKLGQSAVEVV